MRDIQILQQTLEVQCPNIHKKRLNSLILATQTIVNGAQLTLTKLGHDTRIMAVKNVVPHSTKGKNDLNDAVAICQAVQHTSTRFVPVKSPKQQAILSVHRECESSGHYCTTKRNIRITLFKLTLTQAA